MRRQIVALKKTAILFPSWNRWAVQILGLLDRWSVQILPKLDSPTTYNAQSWSPNTQYGSKPHTPVQNSHKLRRGNCLTRTVVAKVTGAILDSLTALRILATLKKRQTYPSISNSLGSLFDCLHRQQPKLSKTKKASKQLNHACASTVRGRFTTIGFTSS